MRPQWFGIQNEMLAQTNPLATLNRASNNNDASETELPEIPLDEMWADDRFWMPLMFAGRFFVGRADFTAGNKMRKWWFGAEPSA